MGLLGVWGESLSLLRDETAPSERYERVENVSRTLLENLWKLVLEVYVSEAGQLVHELVSDQAQVLYPAHVLELFAGGELCTVEVEFQVSEPLVEFCWL